MFVQAIEAMAGGGGGGAVVERKEQAAAGIRRGLHRRRTGKSSCPAVRVREIDRTPNRRLWDSSRVRPAAAGSSAAAASDARVVAV
jgi:hypothetical protein